MNASPPAGDPRPGPRPVITIRPKHSRRVRAGHPWLYSNEIEMTPETRALAPGTVVAVADSGGERLGAATFNPGYLIAARMLSRDAGAAIDAGWLAGRLERARALRDRLLDAPCYRLVHGEADGLPGLVVDRYGGICVAQLNSAGMERLGDALGEALFAALPIGGAVIRRDGSGRRFEGLETGPPVSLGETETPVRIVENGCGFLADPLEGQKTGWFFDHRENRARAAALSAGCSVLDLYCYLGGFGIQAAAAGAASALGIDRSAPALDLARRTAAENGLAERCRFLRGDVFEALEEFAAEGRTFDVVIADPPAFVKVRKDLKPGLRGYRKLVRLAAAATAPRGILCVASCSFHVDALMLGEQIRRGLADAGRSGRILHLGGAGPDHPVHPHLAESAYLKCFFLQLD